MCVREREREREREEIDEVGKEGWMMFALPQLCP